VTVISGSYSSEDILEVWFKSALPVAKETLAGFPLLGRLLDNFSNYGTRLYCETKNSIMFLCLPRINGGKNQVNRLETLEQTLSILAVDKWPLAKRSALKSRIASYTFEKSYSVQSELEAVADLLQVVGAENVVLYPGLDNGRYSDIQITLHGKKIYFEIGNLSVSLPERNIERILMECAEHLGKQMSHSNIKVEVDSAEFIFSNKGILDVPATVKKINTEIDSLKLFVLAGFQGFFEIRDASWIKENVSTLEHFVNIPSFEHIIQLPKDLIFQKWLNSLKNVELIKASVVKTIIAHPMSKEIPLLAEIHTEGLYPSQAEKAAIQSFANHLVRHVKTQLSEQQMQLNSINIISIRIDKFMLSSPSLFAEFSKLRKGINQLFEAEKNKDLTGLALYSDNIRNAIFFPNPFAIASSRLTETEMKELGLHFPTFKDFF
jgi:hypothetical protein